MKSAVRIYGVIIALFLAVILSGCTERKNSDTEQEKVFYSLDTFCMGADLSFVNQLEDNGAKYYDEGKEGDVYAIMKAHGCNLIRMRLWHTPAWTAGTGTKMYSDLADVTETVSRAKSAGMGVNLDIHYSDNWADPQKQETPAAWKNLSFDLLLDSVYNYTYRVIMHFKALNLMPEMVQIGNEINPGMLFPYGKVSESGWENLGKIINSGIKAVRDASAGSVIKPQIVLHAAQPENVEWWFTNIINNGKVADFDIIGLSYYSKWSSVPLGSISGYILRFKTLYNRKVMIVETAYPWTGEGEDNYNNLFGPGDSEPGYELTVEGQAAYLKELVNQVVAGKGHGIQYWEPAWISSPMKDQWGTGSAWENNALFDFDGKPVPGMDYMCAPYKGLQGSN